MRWGDRDDEFVRPVHWVVLLFGDEIIPATLLGIPAGRETRGHRFHHPKPLYIAEPSAYAPLLQTEGKVIADFHERRQAIRAQTQAAANEVGGHAVIDPDLLNEVTALVEWPVAITGNFEQRFLNIPAEALVSAMQNHQKYFPIVDVTGRLTHHFVTICNIESNNINEVREGNERVIRPRFSDAEFFWHQDLKQPLSTLYPMLKDMIFQHRLGSLHDKSERSAALARTIAEANDGDPDWAERAARLAKCDLLTQMVQEFPELQGIMGRYYAQHDGEADDVAQALEDQYRPRFAGDTLPLSNTGSVIALAERLDTLLGIFAIGQAPSGAKDPFALRRIALGILRILIEGKLNLDLVTLLSWTAKQFPVDLKAENCVEKVFEFVMERLRGYYLEQGIRTDTFEAVLACHPTRPLDFERRIRAVEAFRELPESVSIAAANKRIRNILKQVKGTLPFKIHMDRLMENEEQNLAGHLAELSSETIPLMEAGLYAEALTRLAALRAPVDDFFDAVMVMTDDPDLRENRIALLNELGSLFLRVADFSHLQN
jgi:glycyl-tRNA synthetase beta chain